MYRIHLYIIYKEIHKFGRNTSRDFLSVPCYIHNNKKVSITKKKRNAIHKTQSMEPNKQETYTYTNINPGANFTVIRTTPHTNNNTMVQRNAQFNETQSSSWFIQISSIRKIARPYFQVSSYLYFTPSFVKIIANQSRLRPSLWSHLP